MSAPSPVAVIDIGSNSIKLLVAAVARDGSLVSLAESTEETRIGTGLTGDPLQLQTGAMEHAVESVKNLLCAANPFQPAAVSIVATSAVRDAANHVYFAERIDEATNHELRILSGLEEAAAIARGVRCDSQIPQVERCHLFDLGGGSLELLALKRDTVEQAVSLPLGCVRMTERFVADPATAIPPTTIKELRAHVRGALQESSFRFDLSATAAAVVTGGTATTWRAMRAAHAGVRLSVSDPVLPIDELESWAARLSHQSIEERCRAAGLPAARADVFPAALWTLLEVAHVAGVAALHHSMYNLRFGIAAELLFGPE